MVANQPTSPFAFESRYSLCLQCGGVLPVPGEGGSLTCGGCGRPQNVSPRDMRAIHQIAPHPVTPDPQRIQALRAQDGRPFQTPSGLQSLVVHNKIPEWKLKEGFAAWQSSRQELASTGSYDAAERLLYLTIFLPQFGRDQTTSLQERAFYESAVEVMNIPRHRQLILGQMSRTAARRGDLQAAESWLALCDPAPDDLDMDSTYRASRALLDTMKGNWNEVIRVLGSGTDDVPIADFMDVFCGVLRANAWERLGRVDVAVQLLDRELRRGTSTVASMIGRLPLCEQSYPQAVAAHDAASADKVAASSGGNIGGVLMFVAVPQALIGMGLLVASVANFAGLIEEFGPAGNVSAVAGPAFGGVIMFVISFGLAAMGFKARKSAARARHIRLNGLPAVAQLVNAQHTGTRINGVPQWELTLNVELPDRPPYQASTKLVLTDAAIANMQGQRLHVRVAPDNPSEVVLQLH